MVLNCPLRGRFNLDSAIPEGAFNGKSSAKHFREIVFDSVNEYPQLFWPRNVFAAINAGDDVGTNNGMVQSVVDVVEGHFLTKYAESVASETPHTVADVDGNSTYAGFGWEVWVGVIETECPPGAINQDHTIQTFARFIITQVINHGFCAVNNPADTNSAPLCPPPNGTGVRDPPLRGIFGFFQCQDIDDTIPATTAVPRTGLATGTRLVQ